MRITLFLLAVAITVLPASLGRAATGREVEIPAGEATIAGTLLTPAPSVAVPCVVMLGGTLSHYLRGMATFLQRDHQKGQPFLLKELPAEHPARVFAREVNPGFDKP